MSKKQYTKQEILDELRLGVANLRELYRSSGEGLEEVIAEEQKNIEKLYEMLGEKFPEVTKEIHLAGYRIGAGNFLAGGTSLQTYKTARCGDHWNNGVSELSEDISNVTCKDCLAASKGD